MEQKYVFIGKKADGTLVCHTDKNAMAAIDNVTTVLKKFPLEEYEAAGSLVREINGVIVLGKTPAELQAEENEGRKAEIDRELAEINVKQSRSSAEIADALANGRTPDAEAVSFHTQREQRAAALRQARTELLAS